MHIYETKNLARYTHHLFRKRLKLFSSRSHAYRPMRSPTLIALLSATLAAVALGQTCQQGSAIVRLVSADTCSDVEPVMECVSKMQISTTPMCSLQFQPDLKVTDAGTFCEISRGLLQRGAAFGKWSMGKSDIDFQIKNLNNPAYPTVLVLNMKGRVVPDQGGRETQLDCNLFLNVTAGSALGVVSMGQDSLMSTTYTGPALAGATTEAGLSSTGMYGSSLQNGVMQQQPGTIGMGMQQQPGTIGMQNGQMAANGGNPYTAATSSAGSLFVRVNCIALLLAGLISVVLL